MMSPMNTRLIVLTCLLVIMFAVVIMAGCTTEMQQCTYCWRAMPHH